VKLQTLLEASRPDFYLPRLSLSGETGGARPHAWQLLPISTCGVGPGGIHTGAGGCHHVSTCEVLDHVVLTAFVRYLLRWALCPVFVLSDMGPSLISPITDWRGCSPVFCRISYKTSYQYLISETYESLKDYFCVHVRVRIRIRFLVLLCFLVRVCINAWVHTCPLERPRNSVGS
jgi:hypothetical protein